MVAGEAMALPNQSLVRLPAGMVAGRSPPVQVTASASGAACGSRTRTWPFPRCSSSRNRVNGVPVPPALPAPPTRLPCKVSRASCDSPSNRPAGSAVSVL